MIDIDAPTEFDRYRVVMDLRTLVRKNKLPQYVNWIEVWEYWIEGHKPELVKKVYPKVPQPRFYDRALTANRRAIKAGAEGRLTATDLETVWTKYDGKCLICGTDELIVFDHVIPFYRGGTNYPDNLQLLCRLHNMEKGVN